MRVQQVFLQNSLELYNRGIIERDIQRWKDRERKRIDKQRYKGKRYTQIERQRKKKNEVQYRNRGKRYTEIERQREQTE